MLKSRKMKKPYLRKQMAVNNSHPSAFLTIRGFLILTLLMLHAGSLTAQSDTAVNKQRLKTVILTTSVGYGAGLIVLNHIWYKDTNRQSFQFFNDNDEWKQLDKSGHFINSFYLSYAAFKALTWCRIEQRKASLAGALTGFLLTVPIEILDGFSDGYGASVGDVVADAAGPTFFLLQQLSWNEVRIYPKFSFHRTRFPQYRPELLGDNLVSEIVKDYNGQTHWLSFDVDKFTNFPKWLNLAIGYGAEEMTYARDSQNIAEGYYPYRQYYLAIDFDLTAIKTRSRFLKSLLQVVNAIKLPAPTVEFSRKGSGFHLFYW